MEIGMFFLRLSLKNICQICEVVRVINNSRNLGKFRIWGYDLKKVVRITHPGKMSTFFWWSANRDKICQVVRE